MRSVRSSRLHLAVERLVAADAPGAANRALLQRLLPQLPGGLDGRFPSRLNRDGSPLQLSLSTGAAGVRSRIIADPTAGVADPAAGWALARSALRRTFAAHAGPELAEAAGRTMDAVVPAPGSHPAHGVTLADFRDGLVWIAASPRSPGAACYADLAPYGTADRFAVVRDWLTRILPAPREALALVERVGSAAEPASVGLEGTSPADARAKIYFRLRSIDTPLAALGVPAFTAEPMTAFLRAVLRGHGVPRTGLLLNVGVGIADGALIDVKTDICAHCLPYTGEQWCAAADDLTTRFGLPELPLRQTLHRHDVDAAFLGLGLGVRGDVRVNAYLKADPARGRLTPARRTVSVTDAVHALAAAQRPDGSWVDYELPVGRSDQWVTGYVGHALAEATDRPTTAPAAREVARDAAHRAADWLLGNRTYPAGWGYNRTTGPDADSTSFALALLRALGRPMPAEDRALVLAHWQDCGGCATFRRPDGWGAAHPDVTPLAYLALPDEARRERRGALLRYLRDSRGADGGWPAYWWSQGPYATYRVLQLLTELDRGELDHGDLHCADGPGPGARSLPEPPPNAPFALACALGVERLRGGARVEQWEDALLGQQRPDGRWAGMPSLRVTRPDQWTGGPQAFGRSYRDDAGLITTATALSALTEPCAGAAPGRTPTTA